MNDEHYPGSPGSITPRIAGHIEFELGSSTIVAISCCSRLIVFSVAFTSIFSVFTVAIVYLL